MCNIFDNPRKPEKGIIPGRAVFTAGDEHAAVLAEHHAVDALLMVGHGLQQLPTLAPGGAAGPHDVEAGVVSVLRSLVWPLVSGGW